MARFRDLVVAVSLFFSIAQCVIRPNFVIFFPDDWGWGDLGANWPMASDGHTPNLDKLAAQGLRFTDFHAGASVCTPSRAALLTGRLGLRTGVVGNFNPSSLYGLPLEETTIAEYLQATGYRTGMIGKWHLGMANGHEPTKRGFDSWYGIPYSIDMGCGATPTINNAPQNDEHTSMCPACVDGPQCPADWSCGRAVGCSMDLGVPLFANSTIIEQPVDLDTLSSRYKEAARRFFSDAVTSGKPFFLHYAASHMHVPQNHGQEWSSPKGHFGAALMEMDDEVGNLVHELDRLDMSDNTLVLVAGDNGPWECKCDLSGSVGPYVGAWQKKQGGGGSSGKMTLWEGGHRVVGLARWPGRISPGVSQALTSTLDYLPTILGLAGVKLPTDRHFDGLDLAPVLFHGQSQLHETLFHPLSDACGIGLLKAMRFRSYKAIWTTGGMPECGGRQGECIEHKVPLLFDLDSDAGEASPLEVSDPSYAVILQNMTELLAQVNADIESSMQSIADYSSGPEGLEKVCCNPNNKACSCAPPIAKGCRSRSELFNV